MVEYFGFIGLSLKTPLKNLESKGSFEMLSDEISEIADLAVFRVP